MNLSGEKLQLSRSGKPSNPWRISLYLLLIVAGIIVTRMVDAGRVKPLLSPTPIPTRTSSSFAEQGSAFFEAGDLENAIRSYQSAVEVDPTNAQLWATLARIQTYSSELRTNYELRKNRMQDARQSIDQATALAPDDSYSIAIRALVYDWSASAVETFDERDGFLTEAETSAVRANQLDPENPLALAFYAEVLNDEQKWAQALDLIEQAVAMMNGREADLGDTRMDIYRVYGTVLESLGLYRSAIEEYIHATEVTPNLTFLYLNIGVNYRQLLDYDRALEYFNRAVQINTQINSELQDQDPVPYLAIGKTYLQQGEFFISALNIARALAINSSDSDIYGRLGIVYYKARNYESAIPVLQCAVRGCTEEESLAVVCELGYADCDAEASENPFVSGLALGNNSLEYYYTYSSALAFYSGSEQYPNGCLDAEEIFQELMSAYGDDPIVSAIVAENRTICQQVGGAEEQSPQPAEIP